MKSLFARIGFVGLAACSGEDPIPVPTPPPISISALDPISSHRDLTLDVRVLGSGFETGSRVDWALTTDGTVSPRVRTNSTTFVSASELVANITIQSDAVLGLYSATVVSNDGRTGTGQSRFEVKLVIEKVDLGAGDNSSASGVNGWGHIVGIRGGFEGTPGSRAFLWVNGSLQDLGVLPGMTYSWASDINDNGQVVGASGDGTIQRAFIWTAADGMQALSTLGGPISYAHAINEQGDIVGGSITSNQQDHAAVWRNGVIADLHPPNLAPGIQSIGWDINNLGETVGRLDVVAVKWSPAGVARFLTETPAWPSGNGPLEAALALDDAGRVVGWRRTTPAGPRDLFLWTDGVFQKLGTQEGIAWAINSKGQVVGEAMSGGVFTGVIWRPNDPVKSLTTSQGLKHATALGLNESGWVVGFVEGPTGGPRATLWKVQ